MDRGKTSALLVSGTQGNTLQVALEQRGIALSVVASVDAALARLATDGVDVVLVPVEAAAPTALRRLREGSDDAPVVVVGPESEAASHLALSAGAVEYLPWPASTDALSFTLDSALARSRSNALLQTTPGPDSGLLGESPAMKTVRETLSRVASGTATALVRGETGTGKELVARALHTQSPRKDRPFVKVNTPAMPDSLLESELFGYEKGAFTGAHMRKPGRVELAEGGTLFLDEIGEVSPVMQAKLLRLIQDREYERLGGTRTLKADVRFVAATHRDLEHMVETGKFRQDLFYRLNVVTLWLPPLRAHRDDVSLIAQHYLERFRAANHKPQLHLDAAALRALRSERWPGNVRQLVNFVERLVVLARGDVIGADDVRHELEEQMEFLTQAAPLEAEAAALASAPANPLPHSQPLVTAKDPAPPPSVAVNQTFASEVRPLKEDLRRTEHRAITKALASAKGNRALAARLLGVSRRTLYTKLEEHGIE